MEGASIKIRFLFETHEVVLHPFYFTVLVKECTRPRQGTPKEALVELAYKKLSEIAKTYGVGWTKKAAEVLVRLAVDLEILHDHLHWKGKAYVINTVTESKTELDFLGKLVYLKYFLEGDGAILVHLVRELKNLGELERSAFLNDGGWERVLDGMCEDYLSMALDPEERHRIRTIRGHARKGYAKHTREHWFNPRAATLVDLGIWSRLNEGRIRYKPAQLNGIDMVDQFVSVFDNIGSLDSIFSPAGDFFERAAKLYQTETSRINVDAEMAILSARILTAYEACRDDAYRLADLTAIKDIVSLTFLKDNKGVCEWRDVERAIQKMRETSEKDIRYHVDDWGRPSYLVVTQQYVKDSLSTMTPMG